jgi:CobQ-like glutamine amidotransferase family enzyme
MKIEILYKDICNLYGDSGNITYLEKNIKSKFIYTSILEKPYFVDNDVDLVYIGSMTEDDQELVIGALKPYKDRIKELIEKKSIFLVTGSAFDIFGNYIQTQDLKIEGLGIFDYYVRRNKYERYNTLVSGIFKRKEILGFKSQFTEYYGDNSNYFFETIRGFGFNQKSNKEGINYKNFYGTNLLGPLLILNPLFMKYLLKKLGVKKPILYLEKEAMEAYYVRLNNYHNKAKRDV